MTHRVSPTPAAARVARALASHADAPAAAPAQRKVATTGVLGAAGARQYQVLQSKAEPAQRTLGLAKR